MRWVYRLNKIYHLKKELKEIYANQVIETLGIFMIGIFIPAYLLQVGFSFAEAVSFSLLQWLVSGIFSTIAAWADYEIGVKKTILFRVPVVIAYLGLIPFMEFSPWLYHIAVLLGGLSLSLYWVSINTEYIRSSDRRDEGEQAGMLIGLPYAAAVIGPLVGAAVLTFLGFSWLFLISVLLIITSIVPLFMSDDYKGELFTARRINLLIEKKRAIIYLAIGTIYTADFIFWSLYVFLNYGFLSLGVAASLVGVGMIIFTLVIGQASNTLRGRAKVTRIGGFMAAMLWIMRLVAESELEFMVLSLAGGFIISSFWISLFADFSRFAKRNGVTRSAVFRNIWLNMGHSIPPFLLVLAASSLGLGMLDSIRLMFVMAAAASLVLLGFRE